MNTEQNSQSNPKTIAYLLQNVVKVIRQQNPRNQEIKDDKPDHIQQIYFEGIEDKGVSVQGLLRDMERQGEIKIPERIATFIRQFLETREDIIEFTNQLVGSLGETNELFMATSDFFSDAEGEQIPEEQPELQNNQIKDNRQGQPKEQGEELLEQQPNASNQLEQIAYNDTLSLEYKKELSLTLDNMNVVQGMIVRYLHHNFVPQVQKQEEDFSCRICGVVYQTGRQLGGHMSRRHPGSSDTYNRKKTIHKLKTGQRMRRNYFKEAKKAVKQKAQKTDKKRHTSSGEIVDTTGSHQMRVQENDEEGLEQPIPMEVEYHLSDYEISQHIGNMIFMQD